MAEGFSPRERNGLIVLAIIALLLIAVGPMTERAGCRSNKTEIVRYENAGDEKVENIPPVKMKDSIKVKKRKTKGDRMDKKGKRKRLKNKDSDSEEEKRRSLLEEVVGSM